MPCFAKEGMDPYLGSALGHSGSGSVKNSGSGSENLANRSFLFCIPNSKLQRIKYGESD
jgi:hypothetical protein